jgi:hypothetical protein
MPQAADAVSRNLAYLDEVSQLGSVCMAQPSDAVYATVLRDI